MIRSIIVAVSENHAIGKDNKLIWHLPADLQFFKKLTMSHHILMGRKTFESIGKALPGRTSVIISRNKNYQAPEGCIVCHSIAEGLQIAEERKDTEAFIIGGSEIFNESVILADKIYYTEVKESFEADTFFKFDKNLWQEATRDEYRKDEKNKYDYAFVTYVRK
ncbi:MAG: dihydrofolate reductase [Cytophagaceae bacterium]|jgi:dihydrofolate reductase